MERSGVECRKSIVTGLLIKNRILQGVETAQGSYRAPKVIIATGGMSYPRTGSTGDGYAFARQAGHTITPISGSLVPLEIAGGECRKLQGLTLRNIGLKLWGKGKNPVYEDQGELLFMPYGLSGPIILSASAHMDEKKGPYTIELDLKPALDEKKLDARILRDFAEKQNESIYEGVRGLLPKDMVPLILDRAGIPTNTPVHEITKEQRRKHSGDPQASPIHRGRKAPGGGSDYYPRRCEGLGGRPQDHGVEKMPGAVFCRGDSGCGRLYRWL